MLYLLLHHWVMVVMVGIIVVACGVEFDTFAVCCEGSQAARHGASVHGVCCKSMHTTRGPWQVCFYLGIGCLLSWLPCIRTIHTEQGLHMHVCW